MPGCEGAKVMSDGAGGCWRGGVAGQLVVSVKSPVRVRARVKGWAPVLPMVTVWVELEVVVTRTGLGKVMVAGVTVRLGLADGAVDAGLGDGCAGDEDGEALIEGEGGGVGGGGDGGLVGELELADGVGVEWVGQWSVRVKGAAEG